MFGNSKSTAFKPVPFGQQRRQVRVPRWLLWLLLGIVIGAAGLYYAQQEYLPPRLSAEESVQFKTKAEEATKERDQMAAQLAQATEKMKVAQAERTGAVDKMNAALASVEPIKKDLDLFLKSMPPDPRGNVMAIRAGNFNAIGGKLNYHVLFTRERAGGEPFRGVMQLFVAGRRAGREDNIVLEPQKLALDGYQHLNGSLPLPDGFIPREIAVKVLKGPGGESVSLRVFRL